ncbi:hypothetical protein EJ076_34935 [Mesorhizobium sp. M7D.F.Ca.US.005.01.1.1]|uniref:hypothetical protein n=1 Tax=Mesorhizobium sp. M7D.F.Ca.US.005.01.1.1 TaxID=2493678 RepID=UPI000F751959|nr:hypothetical protein [Mesorhizobium sp. M7D.F.Ca.US.005.01.1.1]AZO45912.1 hypothetical protein EJ076_34935 [Mesorhizobium sp. M7D.F.Ca.US.005.01.1.1]
MASETKHTEGPWEAHTFLVMGGKGMRDRICHVGTSTSLGPPRAYETEANARLIAAAPDMLAALQAFNLKEEWIVSGSADSLTIRVPLAVLQQAAAAVSKATS